MRIARYTAAVLAVAVLWGGSVAAAQTGQCLGGTAQANGAGNV
jgi:hypothetical protein